MITKCSRQKNKDKKVKGQTQSKNQEDGQYRNIPIYPNGTKISKSTDKLLRTTGHYPKVLESTKNMKKYRNLPLQNRQANYVFSHTVLVFLSKLQWISVLLDNFQNHLSLLPRAYHLEASSISRYLPPLSCHFGSNDPLCKIEEKKNSEKITKSDSTIFVKFHVKSVNFEDFHFSLH